MHTTLVVKLNLSRHSLNVSTTHLGTMDLPALAPRLNLGTLPDELILLILDQLDADDYLTLRNLNATSSRFHRLTLDRLYRRFPGCAPEQFLRTITLSHSAHCHELINYVKEVVWYQNYWSRPCRRRCLLLGDRHAIANKLRSSGAILDTTDLSTDLPTRFIGFSSDHEVHWWYLEFFLFFTPNVEKITVHDVWQWDDHSYWFKSLAANPAHFGNLRSITLLGPLRLGSIVPLLTLPFIQILELTQAVDMHREPGRAFSWDGDGEAHADRRLSNGSSLERLIIRESDLHFPSAMVIFGSLNKLKTFTYEHVPHELKWHPGMPPAIFPWVGNIGWGPNTSLESLRLRVDSVVTEKEVSSLCHHVAGPTLARLRSLDIGPCNIETFSPLESSQSEDLQTTARRIVQTFPNTLESLRIQWTYELGQESKLQLLIDILLCLVEAVASSASRLKQIYIVDWPALAGWFPLPNESKVLKRVYEYSGMQFDVFHEKIKGQEPLAIKEDVESGWLWVHKTDTFAVHRLKELSPITA